MKERMYKISIAAELVGVSEKTIYNWLSDGSLKLAHPGFVYLSQVEQVQRMKQEQKSENGKHRSRLFTRDKSGRFSLLSGKLNGKSYKGLTD